MGEAIAGELFTVCTPPTDRISVETPGESTSLFQKPREEKQGGSGGGEEKPSDSGPLDAGWARALHSAAACKVGRCGYRDPAKPPNKYLAAIGCDGYHATRALDPDGRPEVRWGLCPRHREWWKLERIRRAAAKGA